MRRGVLVGLLGLLVQVTSGCHRSPAEPTAPSLEAYGLTEAPQDRPLVRSAVRLANFLLKDVSPSPTLQVGWEPASASANNWRVFAASTDGAGRAEIIDSHEECKCVLVRVGRYAQWSAEHTGSSEALINVDEAPFFAYMLLHEAGHIIKDRSIGEAAEQAASANSINRIATAQKEREWAADDYAIGVIKAAEAHRGTDRSLTATNIAMSLSQLAWNLQVHRSLDQFGSTIVRAPSVFWDSGFSHPNLEWRILRANALIQGTDVAKSLLREFEEARSTEQAPLFIKKTL